MTEDDLQAEKRGFEYLNKLVKTLRLDVDQICDQIRASIETKLPNKKAHLRRDGKGRIKERIHTVFAVTEVEYRKSKIRLNQSKLVNELIK